MNADFVSVTHSLIRGASVLESLAEAHDLDSAATCRLLKSSLNDTYLLTTRGNRFVVRVYRASRTASEVAYELELLNHLAAMEVPVSTPVAAKDGRLFLSLSAPEGTRHVVLFSYLCGAPIVWTSSENCYRTGRLLAAIHSASDQFESGHARPSLDRTYLLDSPLAAVEPFLSHRGVDRGYLDALATKLRLRLSAATEAGLDWGVCHGDFGAKNILIRENEVVALDFDFCGSGWRSYDFTSIRRTTIAQNTPMLWEAFLRGYTDIRPLADVDREAVHIFRALRALSMMGVFARNVEEWGTGTMDDKRLDRWLRFFRSWEAEPLEARQ
jgi:Ser/Thr protein kinase RdoA (MazF antagonist)